MTDTTAAAKDRLTDIVNEAERHFRSLGLNPENYVVPADVKPDIFYDAAMALEEAYDALMRSDSTAGDEDKRIAKNILTNFGGDAKRAKDFYIKLGLEIVKCVLNSKMYNEEWGNWLDNTATKDILVDAMPRDILRVLFDSALYRRDMQKEYLGDVAEVLYKKEVLGKVHNYEFTFNHRYKLDS